MRLLQLTDDGGFSLTEFLGKNIPQYAIFSHTWGPNNEEVAFKDLVDGVGDTKSGYNKLLFCGAQAANDGLQYFWIDTCCIDKSSSAELSEAINSMFRWYQESTKCYVYLSDVSTGDSAAFRHSRWFTRGWTLQELLAPTTVEFYSVDGGRLGDKRSLVQEIHAITAISVHALQGASLSDISVEERMSWAANRETTREEDAAYSLLGIFDIHMPLIYGEGRKKALIRLQKKIMKSLQDEVPTLLPMMSSNCKGAQLGSFPTVSLPDNATPRVNVEASSSDIKTVTLPNSDEQVTWHGQFRCIPGRSKDSSYIRMREELADATYDGDWRMVIALLKRRNTQYGEIWANCWRIVGAWGSPTGWTPLHQAAWHGASREVVQELLRLGAWRLARTLKSSGRSHSQSTPYDIARDNSSTHLYDLLVPIIRRPVEIDILQSLQLQLHALITRCYPEDLLKCFILPELEVLTEFEHSSLWFPVDPEFPDAQGRLGVHIILNRDELVVVVHRVEGGTTYHISTNRVQEIMHT